MIKNFIIAVLATAVVVGSVMWGTRPAPPAGAIAGPDIPSSYLKWGVGNGVRIWPVSQPLTKATTTPCAMQSPSATSTLMEAGVKLDVASTSATVWTIAQAATAYATTTNLGTDYAVGASKQAFIQASSTPAAGAATVFAPNTYVVVGAAAGITAGDTAGTGFVPSGTCQAIFVSYPTY